MATNTNVTALTKPQQAWVDALRSGKYKQTTRVLCRLDGDGEPVGYCCLGVACEIARAAGLDVRVGSGTHKDADETLNVRYYEDQPASLPELVRDWLGLWTGTGTYETGTTSDFEDGLSLAGENDGGATFEQIAAIIESRPLGLFEVELGVAP